MLVIVKVAAIYANYGYAAYNKAMPMLFEEFAQAYAEEGSTIDPAIMHAGESGRPSQPQSMHDQEPLLASIVEAGALLRHNPTVELVTKPLQRTFPRGTTAHALRLILNTSVLRPGTRPSSRNFTSGPVTDIDACAMAEDFFLKVFGDLQKFKHPTPSCDVFMAEGKPLLIRKNRRYGAPSALSLARCSINGVVYPPFSLMNMAAEDDMWRGSGRSTRLKDARPSGIRCRPSTDIHKIGFMRISTLALPLTTRREHFCHLTYNEMVISTRQVLTTIGQAIKHSPASTEHAI